MVIPKKKEKLFKKFLKEALTYYKINQRPIIRYEDIGTFQVLVGETERFTVPFVIDPECLYYPTYVLRRSAWHECIHLYNMLRGESVPLFPHHIYDAQIAPNIVEIDDKMINKVYKNLKKYVNDKGKCWYFFMTVGLMVKDVYVFNELINSPVIHDVIKSQIWNMNDQRLYIIDNNVADFEIFGSMVESEIYLHSKPDPNLNISLNNLKKEFYFYNILPNAENIYDEFFNIVKNIKFTSTYEEEYTYIMNLINSGHDMLEKLIF